MLDKHINHNDTSSRIIVPDGKLVGGEGITSIARTIKVPDGKIE